MDSNDNPIFILPIALLTGISVWLYFKYKAEKKKGEEVSKENAKLIADNALLEAEQLKFQLHPHTLNNLLYDLKLTASKVNKGLASLSEILQYILYKGKSHLVSVEDEMGFIKEYLQLNEQFISEFEAISEDYTQVNKSSKHFKSPCIPHLITAYFVENAFKHGDLTQRESLKISLRLTEKEFELNVINRVKQKPTKSQGGIGLENMKKRLELIVGGKYELRNQVVEDNFHSTLVIQL